MRGEERQKKEDKKCPVSLLPHNKLQLLKSLWEVQNRSNLESAACYNRCQR